LYIPVLLAEKARDYPKPSCTAIVVKVKTDKSWLMWRSYHGDQLLWAPDRQYHAEHIVGAKLMTCDRDDEIIREQALNYLKERANPETSEGFQKFVALINQIEHEGITVIWDNIKESISNKLSDLLQNSYSKQANFNFLAFLERGKRVSLSEFDFHQFKKELLESNGYHEYCSQTLYLSNFFNSRIYAQNDSETQRIYDQQYRVSIV
jgi:hypothetical protein